MTALSCVSKPASRRADRIRKFASILWVVLMACVIIGSLLPASSSVLWAAGWLPLNDKGQHFGAYLGLSLLPVIGFQNGRRGLLAGLSMFVLSLLLEAGQHFAPGRTVDLGDVLANGAGVGCGVVLARLIRGPIDNL